MLTLNLRRQLAFERESVIFLHRSDNRFSIDENLADQHSTLIQLILLSPCTVLTARRGGPRACSSLSGSICSVILVRQPLCYDLEELLRILLISANPSLEGLLQRHNHRASCDGLLVNRSLIKRI